MMMMSHLEAGAAVEVLSYCLLQDNGGTRVHLQAHGQRNGLRGARDQGTQGLLSAPCQLGAQRHGEHTAEEK